MFCCVEVENPPQVIQLPVIQLKVIKSPSGIDMLRHFSTRDISNSASAQLFSKSIRISITQSISISNHSNDSSPTLSTRSISISSIDSNESSPTLLTRRISSSSIYNNESSPALSESTISNESSPSNSIDSNGSSPMSTSSFGHLRALNIISSYNEEQRQKRQITPFSKQHLLFQNILQFEE